MVWTDIDHEFEAEFNRWYDEEHISQLLRVPGFLSAGRYAALKGGPKYLAMYELEDHNVLRTAAYLDTVKYQPSPQRARIGTSRVGRNFLRNAYRQIFPLHTHPIEQTVGMAPFLQMGRIDVSAAIEEEFNAWYNTVYIPQCPDASALAGLSLSRASPNISPSTSLSMPRSPRAIPGPEPGQAIRGRVGYSRICATTRGRLGFTSAYIRNSRVERRNSTPAELTRRRVSFRGARRFSVENEPAHFPGCDYGRGVFNAASPSVGVSENSATALAE